MKKIYLCLLVFMGFQAMAKTNCTPVTLTASSVVELNTHLDYMELNSTTESITLIINGGTYNSSTTNILNRDIEINTAGGCSCTIKGETDQQVILKGDVSWKFNGSKNLTIEGIIFRNITNGGPVHPVVGPINSVVYFGQGSSQNTIKKCNFLEITYPSQPGINVYLKMEGGRGNKIIDSYFQNKSSDGNYIELIDTKFLKIENTMFREFGSHTFTGNKKRYIYALRSESLTVDGCTLQNKYSYWNYVYLQDGKNNKITETTFNENDSLGIVGTGSKDYIKILNDTLPSILSNTFVRKFSDSNFINYVADKISGAYPENLGGYISNNTFGPKYQRVESSVIKIGNCDPGYATDVATTGVIVNNNEFREYNYNHFDYYEIISNKSSGNIYENNVFKNCNGNLRLRCGNDVTVRNNKFIRDENAPDNSFYQGPGVSFFAGIGLSGTGHRIHNNHFENLIFPVLDIFGGFTNNYVTVDDLVFAFNTIVNCSFNIRFNAAPGYNEMTVNSKLENNIFYNDTQSFNGILVVMDSDYSSVPLGNDYTRFNTNSFENNIFYVEDTTINIREISELGGVNNWVLPDDNPFVTTIITSNPNLSYNSTEKVYELTGGSTNALNSAYNNAYYSYVSQDIYGTNRGANRDIGCHEFDAVNRPANAITGLVVNTKNTALVSYPNPVKDIFTIKGVAKNTAYAIYSITGVKVQTGNILKNETIDVSSLNKGMYVLELEGAKTIKLIKN